MVVSTVGFSKCVPPSVTVAGRDSETTNRIVVQYRLVAADFEHLATTEESKVAAAVEWHNFPSLKEAVTAKPKKSDGNRMSARFLTKYRSVIEGKGSFMETQVHGLTAIISDTTKRLWGGEEAAAGWMISNGLGILWVTVMEEEMARPCDELVAAHGGWFRRLR
ncbi:ribosome small subunit-dependent GTPase A [Sesbania bispinosa]|nr:ribosome small subunit-dependent GTPase A [Sesbania bispinosa]